MGVGRRIPILALVLLIALPSAFAASAPVDTVLVAKLTGRYLHTAETASGTARITLRENQVCWKFTYKRLDQPTDSGIHAAPPPPAGRRKTSILPFTATTTMKPACVKAPASRIELVVANPTKYYVDIHTRKYPKGAIGGRLRAP